MMTNIYARAMDRCCIKPTAHVIPRIGSNIMELRRPALKKKKTQKYEFTELEFSG